VRIKNVITIILRQTEDGRWNAVAASSHLPRGLSFGDDTSAIAAVAAALHMAGVKSHPTGRLENALGDAIAARTGR